MNTRLSELDMESLRVLYENETSKLREALINGVSWDDLRDQRINVTDLAIALHKKRFALTNPAEGSNRQESK